MSKVLLPATIKHTYKSRKYFVLPANTLPDAFREALSGVFRLYKLLILTAHGLPLLSAPKKTRMEEIGLLGLGAAVVDITQMTKREIFKRLKEFEERLVRPVGQETHEMRKKVALAVMVAVKVLQSYWLAGHLGDFAVGLERLQREVREGVVVVGGR